MAEKTVSAEADEQEPDGPTLDDQLKDMLKDALGKVAGRRAGLTVFRKRRAEIIAKCKTDLETLDAVIAENRKLRDAALADVRRLNRALGLREDGTARKPRGQKADEGPMPPLDVSGLYPEPSDDPDEEATPDE